MTGAEKLAAYLAEHPDLTVEMRLVRDGGEGRSRVRTCRMESTTSAEDNEQLVDIVLGHLAGDRESFLVDADGEPQGGV